MTWFQIWLWKLKFSILVCLFVYLFVCTSRFANFAKGKWSNYDSKNCSEIRAVTWSVIWLWKLLFTILTFFTPLYMHKSVDNQSVQKLVKPSSASFLRLTKLYSLSPNLHFLDRSCLELTKFRKCHTPIFPQNV